MKRLFFVIGVSGVLHLSAQHLLASNAPKTSPDEDLRFTSVVKTVVIKNGMGQQSFFVENYNNSLLDVFVDDMEGKRVATFKAEPGIKQMAVSELSVGEYMITVADGRGEVLKRKRFVKR